MELKLKLGLELRSAELRMLGINVPENLKDCLVVFEDLGAMKPSRRKYEQVCVYVRARKAFTELEYSLSRHIAFESGWLDRFDLARQAIKELSDQLLPPEPREIEQ